MAQNTASMGRYRGLLTDTDRKHISGESDPSRQQRDQAVYRVRQRIREELPQDMEVLAEHHPEAFKELCEVVRKAGCDGDI